MSQCSICMTSTGCQSTKHRRGYPRGTPTFLEELRPLESDTRVPTTIQKIYAVARVQWLLIRPPSGAGTAGVVFELHAFSRLT